MLRLRHRGPWGKLTWERNSTAPARAPSLWRGRDLKGYHPPFLLYPVRISRSPLSTPLSTGVGTPPLTTGGTIPSGYGVTLQAAPRSGVATLSLVSARCRPTPRLFKPGSRPGSRAFDPGYRHGMGQHF